MIRYYFLLLILSLSSTMSLMACEQPVADFVIDKIDGRLVLLRDKSQNADSITWYGVNMDKDVFVAGSNLKLFPDNTNTAVDLATQTDISAFTLCTASLPRTCNDVYTFKIEAVNECGTVSQTREVRFSTQTMNTNTVFGSAQTVHKTMNGYLDENNYDSVMYLSGYSFVAGRSSISILKPASHSQVEYLSDNYSDQNGTVQNEMAYTYKPAKDFVGNDTAIVLVKSNFTYFDTVTIVLTVEDAFANGPVLPFEHTEMTVQSFFDYSLNNMSSCFVGLTSKGGRFNIESGGLLTAGHMLDYKDDSVFYIFHSDTSYIGTDKTIISATKNNITKQLTVNLIFKPLYNWPNANGLPSVKINALYQFSSDTILVGTEGKGLYVSSDGGYNWVYNSLNGVAVTSILRHGSTLFVGTYQNGIYTANAWDRNWQWKNQPFSDHIIYDIKANHDTVFIATGGSKSNVGIYYTANEGLIWNKLIDNTPTRVIGFGEDGRMFYSAPAGIYTAYTDDYNKINIISGVVGQTHHISVIGQDSVVFFTNIDTYLSTDNGQTVKSLQSGVLDQDFFEISGKYFYSTNNKLLYAFDCTMSYRDTRSTCLDKKILHLIRTKNSLIAASETEIFVSDSVPFAPLSLDAHILKPYTKKSKNGRLVIQVNGGTYPYSYKWSNSETSDDLQNIAIGGYTVTVTDAMGQSMIKTITVEPQIVSVPLSLIAKVRQATFYNVADGALDLTVAGGIPPYTYKWNNGNKSEDLARIQSGHYTVTVSDADGDSLVGEYSIGLLHAGTYSLSGTIYYNGSIFSSASVVLYSNVTGSYLPFLIVEANDAGTYIFSNLPKADYVLQAVPHNNDGVSPTYAYHSIRYSDALQIHLIGNTSHFDIDMQPTVAHETGSGKISGKVHTVADAVITNGIFSTLTSLKNSLKNWTPEVDHVIITIYSDGEQVDWDETDSTGAYSICELPTGEYEVLVEIPGFGVSQQTVTISEATNAVIADFTIVDNAIVPTSVSSSATSEIAFYPNPVSDILYLYINNAETVQIFSISGEIIVDKHHCNQLSVEHLMPGTYLLKVIASGLETTQLFIKE